MQHGCLSWEYSGTGPTLSKGWVARTFAEPIPDGLVGRSERPSPSFLPGERVVCLVYPHGALHLKEPRNTHTKGRRKV